MGRKHTHTHTHTHTHKYTQYKLKHANINTYRSTNIKHTHTLRRTNSSEYNNITNRLLGVYCITFTITRMTGPDCAVMCIFINTHTYTHTHTLRDPVIVGRAYLPHMGDFVELPPKPNSKTLVFCFFFNSGWPTRDRRGGALGRVSLGFHPVRCLGGGLTKSPMCGK